MRYLRFLALAAVAVLSTGCIRATYTMNLKPDGSGTIQQTMAMTSVAMQQAQMMAGADGSLIPSEDKMRAAAADMGKGVRFVSSTPYKEGGFDGVTATYAFDDIRTLALSMDQMMAGAIDSPMTSSADDSQLKLAFTRGAAGTSMTLTMPPVPEPTAEEREAAEAAVKNSGMDQMPPEAQAMMKSMLDGLLFEVALNIDGTIVSTNAPYKEGNKILLVQLNGTELLNSGMNLGQLMGMSGGGGGSLEELLRSTPGVKLVTQPELKISFR